MTVSKRELNPCKVRFNVVVNLVSSEMDETAKILMNVSDLIWTVTSMLNVLTKMVSMNVNVILVTGVVDNNV